MREIRLPLGDQPYNFNLLLAFVRRIASPARLVVDGDALWRFIDGQPLSFRQVGADIVIRGDRLTAGDEGRIARASSRLLGLSLDLGAFYAFVDGDVQLSRMLAPARGMPLFRAETVFEALVTLIIEQHISWTSAQRAQSTLLRIFGGGVAVGPARVYDFPSPRRLAGASQADLKPLKITNRRIDLIIEIARAVVGGELDLESLRHEDAAAAYERLLKIKGVGHWTASNAIGRALGVYPFVSQNDVALQAAVLRYFHAGAGRKSASLVLDALGPYGEYAGLVGHLLLLRWVLERYPPIAPQAESSS